MICFLISIFYRSNKITPSFVIKVIVYLERQRQLGLLTGCEKGLTLGPGLKGYTGFYFNEPSNFRDFNSASATAQ